MITGIITNAMMASIKSKLAEYKEASETYVVGVLAEGIEAENINFGRRVWDEENEKWYLPSTEKSIKQVIKNIDEFYEARMVIMKGDLYYCYLENEGESATDDIPTCAAEMGIKVIKYGQKGQFSYDAESSTYSDLVSYIRDEEGNVVGTTNYYMCTPDLSGFNPETTYYVSFSDINNVNSLVILDKISDAYTYKEVWYDYPRKKLGKCFILEQ